MGRSVARSLSLWMTLFLFLTISGPQFYLLSNYLLGPYTVPGSDFAPVQRRANRDRSAGGRAGMGRVSKIPRIDAELQVWKMPSGCRHRTWLCVKGH